MNHELQNQEKNYSYSRKYKKEGNLKEKEENNTRLHSNEEKCENKIK